MCSDIYSWHYIFALSYILVLIFEIISCNSKVDPKKNISYNHAKQMPESIMSSILHTIEQGLSKECEIKIRVDSHLLEDGQDGDRVHSRDQGGKHHHLHNAHVIDSYS